MGTRLIRTRLIRTGLTSVHTMPTPSPFIADIHHASPSAK